jgi:hypothetical protein
MWDVAYCLAEIAELCFWAFVGRHHPPREERSVLGDINPRQRSAS